MTEKRHVVYVYGTLRPGTSETVILPGKMFNVGWFPGVVGIPDSDEEEGGDHFFVAERVIVDDETLACLDSYEGYDLSAPATSLYIRKPILDGWIYEYNGRSKLDVPVPSGDWLQFTGQSQGSSARHFFGQVQDALCTYSANEPR